MAKRLAYGLSFTLPLLLAAFVLSRVVNVPIYDEWLWAPLMVHSFGGTLAAGDLWAQQNAHRSFVPSAVAVALAHLSRWDQRYEIAASFACAFALFVLLLRTLPAPRRAAGALVFAALIFGPAQMENWTWGFQLSWFVVNLGIAGAAVGLAARTRGAAVPSALAAIAASLSLLTGFAAWIAGAVALGSLRKHPWWPLLAIAVAACCALGYRFPAREAGFAQTTPLDVALYALVALGAPLAGAFGANVAACFGGAVVGFVAWCALRARGRADAPWFGIAAGGVAGIALVAVGRAAGGIDEALTSRYVTLATLVWLGAAGLLLTRRRAPAMVVALLLLLPWAVTSARGLLSLGDIAALQADELRRVTALAHGRAGDLSTFAPDPAAAAASIPPLRALRLGPFR